MQIEAPGLRAQSDWRRIDAVLPRTLAAACAMPGAPRRLLVFGGDVGGELDGTSLALDGTGAQPLHPANSPSPRRGHALAYDPLRNQAVLFGGEDNVSTLADTWTFDGVQWSERTQLSAPSPRIGCTFAFAGQLQRLVLLFGKHGNSVLDEAWTWDGASWAQQTHATRPSARHRAAGCQAAGGAVFVFGGEGSNGSLGDAWLYGSGGFAPIAATGPSPRAGALLVPVGNFLVLAAGSDGGVMQTDAWALAAGNWLQLPPLFGLARHDAAASTTGTGQVLAIGGKDVQGTILGDALDLSGSGWTPIAMPPAPAGRTGAVSTFDAALGRVVLFGGAVSPVQLRNDTFTWDGQEWREVSPALRPSAREHGAMAYAPAANRTVLFGGHDGNGGCNDTWTFDGATWNQLATTASPSARQFHAMAAEPSGSLVLFGGIDNAFLAHDDTWRFVNTTWQALSPAHRPSPRHYHAMATDPDRNRVVLFGGSNGLAALDDTWTWNGVDWTLESPQNRPTARQYHAMTFAEERNEVLLFGGLDSAFLALDDVWGWNGSDWTVHTTKSTPGQRYAATVANDPIRGETVCAGGSDFVTVWQRTYLFRAAVNASYTVSGQGCPGSRGTPTLAVGTRARPWLGDSFRLDIGNLPTRPGLLALVFGYTLTSWNGAPLPVALDALGMPGCLAWQPLDESVLVVHPGSSMQLQLRVPTSQILIGQRFSNQALVADPAAGNALGASVSNACLGVISDR